MRLIRDVTTRGGRTFGEGRIFRVRSVWRGKLSVGAPAIGVLWGDSAPEIERLHFRHAELLAGFADGDAEICRPVETGFCRVCGCVDVAGCPPDDDGVNCWWSDESDQTLCSRCVPALIVAGKRSHVQPVPYLMRTLDWTDERAKQWLTEHPESVKDGNGGYLVWQRRQAPDFRLQASGPTCEAVDGPEACGLESKVSAKREGDAE